MTFLLGSLTVTLTVVFFWIYLFLLMLVFVVQLLSLYWKILIMLLSQFPLTFCELKMRCPISLHNLWLFLCWVGQMRDVSWEDTLNACAVSEICDRVHSEIHVSSPHCKYHVMLLWSTWFSAACAAGIIHRNHFFVFTNRINLLNLKLSSDSVSHCKRGLEAVKFTYANKTKAPITFQKLGSWDFWWIPNSILNKGKYAILPLFNSLKVASSASDKAILFPRNFSKNSSNLEDPGISLPAFPSWTNLKLRIYVIPKMVKNVIENLESSKASDLDCIPVVV